MVSEANDIASALLADILNGVLGYAIIKQVDSPPPLEHLDVVSFLDMELNVSDASPNLELDMLGKRSGPVHDGGEKRASSENTRAIGNSSSGYSCSVCDYASTKLCNVNSHITYKHMPLSARQWVCASCEHRFVTRQDVERHEKRCKGLGIQMPGRKVGSYTAIRSGFFLGFFSWLTNLTDFIYSAIISS